MFTNPLKALASAAIIAACTVVVPAHAQDKPTAGGLLFDTPYLTEVAPNEMLVYRYDRATIDESRFGPALSDTIRLEVREDETDASKRSAYLKIYTGPRERNIGPFMHASGNPAVMIMLEQDTFEMKRRLGGQPAYFRNKIRKAMREDAKVEEVSFDFNGKPVDGHMITITPFEGDPNMAKLPEYSATKYEFVVSKDVPGGLYRVTSIIPAANEAGTPLKKQDMIFSQKEMLK